MYKAEDILDLAGPPADWWARLRRELQQFLNSSHVDLRIGIPGGGDPVRVQKGVGGALLIESSAGAIAVPIEAVRKLLGV